MGVCDKRYKRIVRVCRIPRGSRMIETAAALIDERYPNDVRYYISGNYDNNLSFISVWIHGVRNNKSFAFSVIACVCLRVHASITIHLCLCTFMCMYICVYMYTCTYIYIYVRVYVYVRAYRCTDTRIDL